MYQGFIAWLNRAWWGLPPAAERVPLIKTRYTPEEQKSFLRDPLFLSLSQAPFMGFQHSGTRCETVCPAGRKK
jgi:hypothetical protein